MSLTENNQIEENIIDLNLDGIKKQKFRINGEPGAIIELNLSDLNIVDRLKKGMKQLQEEVSKIPNIDSVDEENLQETLDEIDAKMRKSVDYIFDFPVSAVCAKSGTMYDVKDGKLRYEIILDGLTKLYEENIQTEYKKFQSRIQKHAGKYTATPKKKKD